MDNMFEAAAENIREQLLGFYRTHFEVTYQEELNGIVVPVLAQMHHREQKDIFGIKLNRLGQQANEYVFFLTERVLDENAFLKAAALLDFAMRELVKPSPIHGYTFLSAVLIFESVDEQTAKKIKRFKQHKNFGRNGWAISRMLAFETNGEFLANSSGVSLGKMLQGIVKKAR